MKVALVHDWLIHMRGGEKVLEAIAEMFPNAMLYTLFYNRKKLSPTLANREIQASFLHYLPGIRLYYRWLLPILPLAIRSIKIEEADLVISSSHCVAKGIKIPQGARHLCYCHTPMRYIWGFEDIYFKKFPFWVRQLMQMVFTHLRKWDIQSNASVHEFISNSENVRQRIQKFYDRDAHVIYPPIETAHFKKSDVPAQDYYLAVSHFVPYKRMDLVIRAFNGMDRQLLVVGRGPLGRSYRKLRRNEKISFLGTLSAAKLRELYAGARALIFPAEEDFGMVPVEAQSCGTPVIAYGKGGSLESVRTGVFFEEQTPEAVQKAVEEYEKKEYDREAVRRKVADFDKEHFKQKIREFIDQVVSKKESYAHC